MHTKPSSGSLHPGSRPLTAPHTPRSLDNKSVWGMTGFDVMGLARWGVQGAGFDVMGPARWGV